MIRSEGIPFCHRLDNMGRLWLSSQAFLGDKHCSYDEKGADIQTYFAAIAAFSISRKQELAGYVRKNLTIVREIA